MKTLISQNNLSEETLNKISLKLKKSEKSNNNKDLSLRPRKSYKKMKSFLPSKMGQGPQTIKTSGSETSNNPTTSES